MKVLLSAYACEPNKGSESEMGWKAIKHLASTSTQLIVVTKKSSESAITAAFPSMGISNTQFIYYDMPEWINTLRRNLFGMQVHAYLWEMSVFFFLLKKFKRNEFDFAYKTTIASFRFPSFVWFFAKHFTWGPLCSGEKFPFQFLSIFSWKGKILEFMRLGCRKLALLDPLVLLTLYKADQIIAITSETKAYLPSFARKKTTVETEQHIIVEPSAFDPVNPDALQRNDKLRLLYIGRLLEWKGLMLVLRALAGLRNNLDYEFTIMGEGPAKIFYEQYARKHKLNAHFVSPHGIPRRSLSAYYLTHDLFIFPGLHGIGSTVMVEAKVHNLPVLMLDITVPDAFDHVDFGIEIPTKNRTVSQIINQIAQELLTFRQVQQRSVNPLFISEVK